MYELSIVYHGGITEGL